MTAQVIPVRTTGPAQTEWMDLTAAAHQDLMEHNAKQVTLAKLIYFLHSSGFLNLLQIVPK